MPAPPFNATFFYPWYQNGGNWAHWGGQESPGYFHNPPANWSSHYLPAVNNSTAFDPSTQLYSSGDKQTFYWQLSQMKAANQNVAIASWWGQGDISDVNFRTIVTNYMNQPDNPYPQMRWAVYYEQEGYGDPSVSQIESDLNYIKANYASQPGYLWVNGKPVVFVYNANDGQPGYPINDVTRWSQARADTGFYVNMKIDPVIYGGVNGSAMDGWHEYDPTSRTDTCGGFYQLASPGYWREQDPPALPRDPNAFTSAVQAMGSANVPWKLTETWNEWIEGSSVEPGTDANWTYDTSPSPTNPNVATQKDAGYGTTYVNILGANLPAPGTTTFSPPGNGNGEGCDINVVAAEGSDRALYARTTGGDITNLGGVLSGAPAVAAVPQASGIAQPLYIVTGSDNKLYVRSNSQGWQHLTTTNPTTCLDNPAAVVTGPAGGATLTVGCQGADHALWMLQGPVSSSGLPSFSKWVRLGGGLTAGPAVAPVGGNLTFFVTGGKGRVYTRTVSSGFVRAPWTCVGHPAAAAYGSTTAFACDGTNHALQFASNSGTGWSPTQSGGGSLIDGPGVAETSRGPFVFAEGSDSAIVQNFFPGCCPSTGWVDEGSSVLHGAGATRLG